MALNRPSFMTGGGDTGVATHFIGARLGFKPTCEALRSDPAVRQKAGLEAENGMVSIKIRLKLSCLGF